MGRSTENQQENGPTPTVACLRCRDQKLRCDRRLPSCTRCHKRKVVCSYPSPPDRKRIAQSTNQSRAARSNGLQRPHQYESSSTTAKPAMTQRSENDLKEDSTPTLVETDTATADLPSTEVGLLLLEVYFTRIYNATLLFHRTTGFQLYIQNELPSYFLRAAFAQAAVFLKEVESPHKKYIKILPVRTLFEKSWLWARAASREVLSHADEPMLYRIQTLQVLQLYYFSQGEIQRATIHASLAYQQCQLLGYDKLYEDFAASSTNRDMLIYCEMRRRCFWAAWCASCIGNDRLDYSKACDSVIGLPLPAKFEKGESARGTVIKPSGKMDANWELSAGSALDLEMLNSESCSLMAELVKLLGIW